MANETPDIQPKATQTLDGGTYEIIQGRLQKQKTDLQKRLQELNEERKNVFGSIETKHASPTNSSVLARVTNRSPFFTANRGSNSYFEPSVLELSSSKKPYKIYD